VERLKTVESSKWKEESGKKKVERKIKTKDRSKR